MVANYYDYQKLCDKLYYGVLLTDEHLNAAAEQIRRYIVDGGATDIVSALGIGLRLHIDANGEIIRRRIYYTGGENKGRELTISEIMNIGFFLRGGGFTLNT